MTEAKRQGACELCSSCRQSVEEWFDKIEADAPLVNATMIGALQMAAMYRHLLLDGSLLGNQVFLDRLARLDAKLEMAIEAEAAAQVAERRARRLLSPCKSP